MGRRRGFWQIGRWQDAPVRVHWTLPLGLFLFGGGRLAPGAWLGVAIIILVHEVGHALVVQRYRLRVVGIDLHGLGGECRYAGTPTAIQSARIAWGGVNAQLVLCILAELVLAALGPSGTPLVDQLLSAFTVSNFIIIAINLLPIGSLDGVEAWKLPGLLRAQARARAAARPAGREAKAQRPVRFGMVPLDESEAEVPPETAAAVDAKLRELAGGRDKKPN